MQQCSREMQLFVHQLPSRFPLRFLEEEEIETVHSIVGADVRGKLAAVQ